MTSNVYLINAHAAQGLNPLLSDELKAARTSEWLDTANRAIVDAGVKGAVLAHTDDPDLVDDSHATKILLDIADLAFDREAHQIARAEATR